ncbi:C40 family peptidase [Bombilactobacillus folatiphilus]|uniref:C40 family peptidase n=1 Tax=Bombilactobacillus folatiphilus TaxID=2923362 RepID=UPI0037C0433E
MKKLIMKRQLIFGGLIVGLFYWLMTMSVQADSIQVKSVQSPQIQVQNNLAQTQAVPMPDIQVNATGLQAADSLVDPDADETLTLPDIAKSNLFIQTASQYLGVPYVWGGTTPAGFDCSGLVQYVARKNGLLLPRTSQSQSLVGSYVKLADLQPGDLVFWGQPGEADHVGIYVGDGEYIHAPQPGEQVRIGKIQWFKPDFGRRLSGLE